MRTIILVSIIGFTFALVGVYILLPEPHVGIIPQKTVAYIISEFKADEHVFADARRKCREAIRNIESDAIFGYVVSRRFKDSVIIQIDWETKDAEKRSYCRVVESVVSALTIDDSVAYVRVED